MSNSGIFINYRRCDDSGNPRGHALFVETLSNELAEHFGNNNVFIDTSTDVTDGQPRELAATLADYDVLLVVIHPEWLVDLREARSKLTDGEFDRVHQEISAALNGYVHSRGGPKRRPEVIPVLIEKADPPKLAELPEDIRELAVRQAFRLRFGSLINDVTRLISELEIHTSPHWPLSSTRNPKRQRGWYGTAVGSMPGWLTSRGLAAALSASGVIHFAPDEKDPETGQWDWESITYLLVWFAVPIILTFLIAAVTTKLGRSFHQMESRLHSQSAEWRMIARLSFFAAAIILSQPLLIELEEARFPIQITVSTVVFLGTLLLLSAVFVVTINDIRTDNEWPPRVSNRPRELRRAIARLEHRLTSSWQPPLTRIQRDQAWQIVHQLDSAVVALRQIADRTRTRRGWLRTRRRGITVGYAAWLAATLGLAVASAQDVYSQGDTSGGYLSISIGVTSCVLGIGTMELFFRHDRRAQRWFIEEIEKARENRLLRHMPT